MKRLSNKTKIMVLTGTAGFFLAGATFSVFLDAAQAAPSTVAAGTVSVDDIKSNIHIYDTGNGLGENIKDETDGNPNQTIKNVNPGDENPVDITISNSGTKSILTRTYLYVLLPKTDTVAAWNNYHLLIRDYRAHSTDEKGIYGTDGEYVDITKGTKVLVHAGTSAEEVRDFPVEFGYLRDGSAQGQPCVRYTLGQSLNGTKTPGTADEPASSVETESGIEDGDGYSGNGSSFTYELLFHTDSDVLYNDPKEYAFKTFTAAVQYRNSNEADMEAIAVDENFTLKDWR